MSRNSPSQVPSQAQLRLEFGLMFIAAPVLIALLFPPQTVFPALFAFTVVGLALLYETPGFRWRELGKGWRDWPWREAAAFAVFAAAGSWLLVQMLQPDAAFSLLQGNPALLAAVWLGYPIASALPQELLFRVLFYRRYDAILPDGLQGALINAAIFSLAHLMYWSVVVSLLTFAGSLIFTYAYLRRGSFIYAVLLHAVAGNILFTAGMGAYFFSAAVVRPF